MGMEHYVKIRDLGGTNGAFLASDRQMPDRFVVIKRLADGTQGIEELNAALRLRHPHVIRFLESFLFNGALYVVMDYEPGGDLEELFKYLTQRHKTPTTHTLLLWFVQLLEALAYCHAQHVIHRDLKPSNILVSEDTKMLYLGDFGSAKTLDTSNVTSTFVGSPLWISPEVLMGTKYSYAADIWSLGCVFYEMATLRKPFAAPSFAHLVQQITRGHIAPLPPNVAPEVRAIIQSMLRLQPSERTTAAAALEVARAALREAEQRRNVTPTPIRSPAPAARPSPSSSPVRSAAPLVLAPPPPTAPSPPPAESEAVRQASQASAEAEAEAEDGTASSAPPDAVTCPGSGNASAAASPLTAALDADAQSGSTHAAAAVDSTGGAEQGMKASLNVPETSKSPTAAPLRKRRNGGTASSTSASTRSNTPIPVTTPTTATLASSAAATVTEEGEVKEERSMASSGAEPCEPQQMVLNISTGDFRKPVARRRPVTTRNNAAAKRGPAAAAAQPRQQIASVPAAPPPPGAEAPTFVRQPTADAFAGSRRLSTTSAGEVINERRDSLRASEPKVVMKAAPPRALAGRARTAAENADGRTRVPEVSPKRAPPPPANGHRSPAPQPAPMVPTASPPARGNAQVPADQWLDQRMRELSAMENYLHQHRKDDDKVLQTYDARRNEEHQQQMAVETRPPQHRSPAPRRLSPSKAFASPASAPGVFVVSPPAAHKQQRDHSDAASPFNRQASYTRQASDARQPSRPALADFGSRQGSVASVHNGRQASNARPHAGVSAAEHQRLEEERAAAREKREAERERMKALIQEQRAAAKKDRRKPKKGSGKVAMAVDVLVPDHKPAAAQSSAAAV